MENAKPLSLEKTNLANGVYRGLWSAYYIQVMFIDTETLRRKFVDVEVNEGVRGINCECMVQIIDGWLYAN